MPKPSELIEKFERRLLADTSLVDSLRIYRDSVITNEKFSHKTKLLKLRHFSTHELPAAKRSLGLSEAALKKARVGPKGDPTRPLLKVNETHRKEINDILFEEFSIKMLENRLAEWEETHPTSQAAVKVEAVSETRSPPPKKRHRHKKSKKPAEDLGGED